MCGITIVVALEAIPQKELDEAYRKKTEDGLHQSLKEIKHRGPDSEHVWISQDNRVALGMNRLAINDLSDGGAQPFHDATGNVHAVVNGEMYTSDEERAELASWYSFQGHSDCEVIIPLYLKYGVHFLSRLRGEYAFVLYDSRRKLVIAARDRYGIKPLFWTVAGNRLLVSSEAKGFLPLGWKAEWDVRSLLDEGWMHDERTLFKRVHKVRAGHYLTLTAFDYTNVRPYWDSEYPDKHSPDPRSEEEMISTVREKIRNAVRSRMRNSDVPIGIYLSGGIDSSAIAGMAVDLIEEECKRTGASVVEAKKRLKCFCVGFENESVHDESAIAQRTADMLGLEIHMKRMHDDSFAANFADATYHMEQNNPDLNYIGKYMLSDLARRNGYKVILTGEGSDEIFGGYYFFYSDYMREPDAAMPSASAASMTREARAHKAATDEAASVKVLRMLGMSRYISDVPGSVDNAMHTAYPPTKDTWRRMLNNSSFVSQTPSLTPVQLADWTTQSYGQVDARETYVANPDGRTLALMNDKWHPLHADLYLWVKSGLPNYLLTCLGDRMEMGHSVEGRPPFLDHHLTEYVNGLPPSVKIKYDADKSEFTEKWILREAMKPYIADELYKRKKHPFTAPAVVKLGGAMHQLLADLVTRRKVENLGFLDWTVVEAHLSQALDPYRDAKAFGKSARYIYTVAQWVVLSQRFGIAKAEPLS